MTPNSGRPLVPVLGPRKVVAFWAGFAFLIALLVTNQIADRGGGEIAASDEAVAWVPQPSPSVSSAYVEVLPDGPVAEADRKPMPAAAFSGDAADWHASLSTGAAIRVTLPDGVPETFFFLPSLACHHRPLKFRAYIQGSIADIEIAKSNE